MIGVPRIVPDLCCVGGLARIILFGPFLLSSPNIFLLKYLRIRNPAYSHISTLIFRLCTAKPACYGKVFHALAIWMNILPREVSTGLSFFLLKMECDGSLDPYTLRLSANGAVNKSYWQAKLLRCDISGLTAVSQFQKYMTIGKDYVIPRFFYIR